MKNTYFLYSILYQFTAIFHERQLCHNSGKIALIFGIFQLYGSISVPDHRKHILNYIRVELSPAAFGEFIYYRLA